MPKYLTESDLKLWGFSKTLSLDQNIKILLGKMAIFRQAGKVDKISLDLYTQVLVDFDQRAFQVAMRTLSFNPRQEGDPSFPSLGMILEAMDEAAEHSPDFKSGATKINTAPLFAETKNLKLVDGK